MLTPQALPPADAPISSPARRFSLRRVLLLVLLALVVTYLTIRFDFTRHIPLEIALATLAAVAVGGLVCSERRRRRHDLQPDILAALFPSDELLQFDQAHLKLFSAQYAGRLRVVLIAQNVRDVAGPLKVRLTPTLGRRHLAARLPGLSFDLPPAAVVLARLDLPLRPIHAPHRLRLTLRGAAPLRGGRIVRFARRRPVRRLFRWPVALSSPSQWLQRGGGALKIPLRPFPESGLIDPLHCFPAWTLCTLWIPADPVPLATITRTLAQVRSGSTSRFLG